MSEREKAGRASGTGAMPRPWAIIRPGCEEQRIWLDSFGTDAIPIRSYRPEFAVILAAGGTKRTAFVRLDARRMEPSRLDALIAHMAAKTGHDPARIRLDLLETGMRIPAEGVKIEASPERGRASWAAPT